MRGLFQPGGQPIGWTVHSRPIEVKSTTPAKSKAKHAIAKSAVLPAQK
jgi:hypothetical protein